LGYEDVDGRIILKWILKNRVWGCELHSTDSGRGRWRAFVNMAMNLTVPNKVKHFSATFSPVHYSNSPTHSKLHNLFSWERTRKYHHRHHHHHPVFEEPKSVSYLGTRPLESAGGVLIWNNCWSRMRKTFGELADCHVLLHSSVEYFHLRSL
jgi:hypothetical protein